MADYRFSAQTISRSKGQSSVASAAYRSASRMIDERTGEIHDYTRKQGVTHSEILAPANIPEWMAERDQLWNAVEAVEKRKNSQLAREIQLSLPHELTDDQRRQLVVDFVQEQFVDRGMIADINIHHPDRKSDERNHHAHIMLTMRELTEDGFHSKKSTPLARSWNDDELLKSWRAEWANHQNRTLERHGHDVRVDHRSYADRGIDREPTQHLGPVANDMEQRGKNSRIGDENRERDKLNAQRAMEKIELIKATAKLQQEQARITAKHSEQSRQLEASLNDSYGEAELTIGTEMEAIDRRLGATGAKKFFRDLFGRTKADLQQRQDLVKASQQIQKREDLERKNLKRIQRVDKQKTARAQTDIAQKLKRWTEKEREAKKMPAQGREKPAQDKKRLSWMKPQQNAPTPSREPEIAPERTPWKKNPYEREP